MLSGQERVEVSKSLRYLHERLKGHNTPVWTEETEQFYLRALGECSWRVLKQAFAKGIERWKWMPRAPDILEVYAEVVQATPAWRGYDGEVCEDCQGSGWVPVRYNTVSPCLCARGRRYVANRASRAQR